MDWELFLTFMLVSFFICMVLTVVAIPVIINIAFKKQLFDVPDYRKVHTGQIPRLGGVSFLPGIMIAVLIVFGFTSIIEGSILTAKEATELMFGTAGALFLYMTGITDDLIGVSYRVKFPIQIAAAFLLCASGLWVDDFNGLLCIHKLPAIVGIPFTVVLIVLIINAINLIDGIDGLASGLCIMGIAVYSVLFVLEGMSEYAIIGAAALGALLPFYIYNVYGTSAKQTKIFMGDAGSLTMGYLIAAFTVKAATFAETMPVTDKGQTYYFVYAFAILLVPVLDVVRLFCHRLLRKRSPFAPDRCHIHHKFIAVGLSIGQARHTIICISLAFFLLNIVLIHYMNINLLLAVDIIIWTLMHLILSHKIKVLKSRDVTSAKKYEE